MREPGIVEEVPDVDCIYTPVRNKVSGNLVRIVGESVLKEGRVGYGYGCE